MIERRPLTRCVSQAVTALAFGAAALLGSTVHAATITEDWTGDDGDPWSDQWTFRNADGRDITIQDNGGNIGGGERAFVTGLINTTTFTDSVQEVDLTIYNQHRWGAGLQARSNHVDTLPPTNATHTYYLALVEKFNPSDPFELYILEKDSSGTTELTDRVTVAVLENGAPPLTGHLRFSVQTVGSQVELIATFTDPDGNITTVSATDNSPLDYTGQVGVQGRLSTQTGGFTRFDSYSVTIPEPATLALGLAGAGLAALPRRRRQRA